MSDMQMGKSIENRIRTGDFTVAAAETHASTTAMTLKELLTEVPALELTPSQIEPFIKALAGLLHAATRDLEARERGYLEELADDAEPRALREAKTAESTDMLQRARELVSAVAGDEGLDRYELRAPINQVPSEVASRLERAIHLLDEYPLEATDALGTSFNSKLVADKLRGVHSALNEALGTVKREEKELQEAISAREEAIEAWTNIYRGVASALIGLYGLTGRFDLVEQYRPTKARIAGREDD